MSQRTDECQFAVIYSSFTDKFRQLATTGRLFQPLLMLTNLVGVGSNGSGDVKAPSVGGLLQRCFQVPMGE